MLKNRESLLVPLRFLMTSFASARVCGYVAIVPQVLATQIRGYRSCHEFLVDRRACDIVHLLEPEERGLVAVRGSEAHGLPEATGVDLVTCVGHRAEGAAFVGKVEDSLECQGH